MMQKLGVVLIFLVTLGLLTVPAIGSNDSQPAQLKQLRLYIPDSELRERVSDIKSLARYIKDLEKVTSDSIGKTKKPYGKGLFIAVGIKSGKKSRTWCQAVDGDIPKEFLRKLEIDLAKVETIELKKSPIAFAMEMKLFGQNPNKFPEYPDVWLKATEKIKRIVIIPDDLFKLIWSN
jgi:hypothetical protein